MTAALSLLEALALVPDPRSRHGRIHPLAAVLGLTVTALLAGCKSLDAVAPFGRDRGLALAAPLGFRRGKTPNESALGKIFRRLDLAALDAALRAWLDARGATAGHLAWDGKTLAGSADGSVPGRHLVAAYAAEHAAVVGPMEMARTTNEHKTVLKLLGILPPSGRIVTADAMFTHRAVCDTITDAGGDDLLAVKGNQESLKADLEAEFAPEANRSPSGRRRCEAERQTVETLDEGHGRIEKRRITATAALDGYLHDWPKLAQGVRVERERRVKGISTVEVSYFITSPTRDRADAGRLAEWIRGHWKIENRPHYVRDVSRGEEACRVRTGSSPQGRAALRNRALHLLEDVKAPSRAASMRRFTAHPHEAIKLIRQ